MSPVPASPFRKTALPAALLVAAVVAVYANSLAVPFLFDDGPAILRNQTIRSLWPVWGVLQPPVEAAGAAGRPLVNLSLAINYALGGFDVRGYHAMNLALHGLAVLVLWGVLRRTMRRVPGLAQPDAWAWCVALLWAVHPLLTESVVCVIQRDEILGGLFYLLTLYGFIRSAEDGATTRWWRAAAWLGCLLGVASKEIVATAPLMVLLYDRTFVAGSFAGAWRLRRGFYLSLAVPWLLLAWLMTGAQQRAGIVGFGLGVSSWDYLVTQTQALTTYLQLSAWPHPLIVDYGPVVSRLGEVWWRGLVVLALLGATGWAMARKPAWGFVGAWFFVILAPSSSFVPLTTQTIAEHRMYLPLVAVLVLAVGALHRFAGRQAVLAAVLGAAALGWATVARNGVYADERRLWMDLVARQPDNPRAQASLGYYFARQQQWTEAEAHYDAAVRLLPGYADAHNDLASVLGRLGRPEEALRHFAAAQQLKPGDPTINFNYGLALAGAGRPAEAAARFAAALRADPGLAGAHAGLADALFDLGRFPEAAEEYAGVLRHQPELTAARHNLALTLVRLGRPAEAIPHYEQVLRILPDSAQVHHNFSLALAQAGRVPEAIAQDEQALRLNPGLTEANVHLAQLRQR